MFINILKGLGLLLFAVLAVVFALLTVYFIVVVLKLAVKNKRCYGRFRRSRFKYSFLKHKFIKPVEFLKWVIIDVFRGKDSLKLFGIWAFTGYFGQGKTLGAVTFAMSLREKYPHRNIKIYTNFSMKGSDGKIKCWEDLLNLPKNTIVIFDEIQSTFTSQKFKDFPIDLLWKLTQCRKNGLAVFCTTPVFSRMSIQLRENTDFVVVCKNRLGLDRWFTYSFYHAPDYERNIESPIKLRLYQKFAMNLVAGNFEYKQYNTNEIVDRLDIVGQDEKNKKMTVNEKKAFKEEIIKEIEKRYKLVA